MTTMTNAPGSLTSGIVNCVAYKDGRRSASLQIAEIGLALERPNCFVWLGLKEPSAELLDEVQQAFGLHELAIEDAHSAHQRPKLERYGDSLFVVLRTAHMERQRIAFGETHFFVGPSYIVSVRHSSPLSHVQVRSRVESTPQELSKGPGFVLYALMDFIVDHYFPLVDHLEDTLEGIEEEIFREKFSRETTERIYELKRNLLELKHAVSPLVEICNRLTRPDLELIPDDTRPYFRDVYDHAIRINERVDTLRELLSGALEANLSLMSVAQNEATKKLAGWAAIIGVPTMLASIYGMNFEFMPELQWRYGYPTVIGLSFAISSLLYAHFKRSGWL
jgi:magnesium transporter